MFRGYLCAKYLMKYYGTREGVVARDTGPRDAALHLFKMFGSEC